jgi:PIN domain nuclease of toxin-antitoxin system
VSSEQALSFSQRIAAAMYVETSAKTCVRAAISAFEVAALASMGKIVPKGSRTPSPKTAVKKQRFSSVSPGDSLDRDFGAGNSDQFWDQFHQSPMARTTSEAAKRSSTCTGSIGSSRSASLSSKTRSSCTSIPSISSSLGSSKTPKGLRKQNSAKGGQAAGDKMITIKCARLTADKTYEEIEVEVPAPIYDTIQLYNDTGGNLITARNVKERRSLGSKLRNLFGKN